MSPTTRRNLWNTVCRVRDSGKSIVLTSHSMEECEALCTRLAIMVNGNFRCLGSIQHLKSKFAKGYNLSIKVTARFEELDTPETTAVEDFVKKEFPTATLTEKHMQLLTYEITGTSMTWSEMFGIMEEAKKRLQIEDYSIGQSTLEQVLVTDMFL